MRVPDTGDAAPAGGRANEAGEGADSTSAGARVRAAYTRWADRYDHDHNRTRDLDHEVMQHLLASQRFGRVLELGCGTGKNTQLLATCADAVTALDFAPAMLAHARTRVPQGHVAFVEADLTAPPWPVPAAAFDLVVCNLVLEHIEDLAPVFVHAGACLAAGGRFIVCELHPFRQYQGTQARFTTEDGAQVLVPAYRHHVSEFCAAAQGAGLVLARIDEWWHAEDTGLPPRLLSLACDKPR